MWTEKEVLTLVSGIDRTELQVWIAQGWVRPAQGEKECVYGEIDVARLRLICELRHDLDVPEDMMPAILSMIDQIYGLRRELRDLVRAIEAQPGDVRQNILNHCRQLRRDIP